MMSCWEIFLQIFVLGSNEVVTGLICHKEKKALSGLSLMVVIGMN